MKKQEIIEKLVKREIRNVERQYYQHCKTANELNNQEFLTDDDKERLEKLKEVSKEKLDYMFDLLEILEKGRWKYGK